MHNSKPELVNLKSRKKRKKRKIKVIAFSTLLLLALIVFAVFIYRKAVSESNFTPHTIVAKETIGDLPYIEVENKHPELYKAIIILNKPTTIHAISEIFYGKSVYWPYIYQENKKVVRNLLDIPTETIIRIPQIDSLLELPDNGVVEAKRLSDKILTDITNENQARFQELRPGE